MQDLWMGGGGGALDPPLVYWLGWIGTVGKLALPIPPQSLRPRCAPGDSPPVTGYKHPVIVLH